MPGKRAEPSPSNIVPAAHAEWTSWDLRLFFPAAAPPCWKAEEIGQVVEVSDRYSP